MTFSFRGLDIRHRLPDRKGVGNLQHANSVPTASFGVSTPQDSAYPSRIHDFGTGSKKQLRCRVTSKGQGLMAIEETYLLIGYGRLLDERRVDVIGVKNAKEMYRRTLGGL